MQRIKVNNISNEYRNILWGRKYFDDMDSFISFSYETSNEELIIQSKMKYYYSHFNPIIKLIGDRIEFSCNCDFHKDHSACGHVVATILLYNNFRFDNEIESLSEKDFLEIKEYLQNKKQREQEEMKLKREYEKKRQISSQIIEIFNSDELIKIDIITNKSLNHLQFEFSINNQAKTYSNRNDTSLEILLRAKVGSDKMYVIKDFKEFFDNLMAAKLHSYGANLEFIHTRNAFEDVTIEVLPGLHQLHDQLNENASVMKAFEISLDDLDYVFNLLKDYPNEYMNIDLLEADYIIDLKVEQINDDEYKVAIESESSIITTNYSIFDINQDYIKRMRFSDEKSFRFAKLLLETDYTIFSKLELDQVLSLLDPSQVKIDGYTIGSNKQLECDLFIDIDNDDITVTSKVEFDNQELNIFHPKVDNDLNISKIKYLLSSYKSSRVNGIVRLSLDNQETYLFLDQGVHYLQALANVYINESLRNIKEPTPMEMQIGVSVDNGLLKVDVNSIQFNKDELLEIVEQYRKKKKFFKLKSGEVLNLAAPELIELDKLVSSVGLNIKDVVEGDMQLPLFRSLQVESELKELETINFDIDNELATFNKNFKEQKLDNITIHHQYQDILKDYQKHGVKWMKLLASYGFNGILADDMGLGKTLQVISLLEDYDKSKPSIVVAPASLLFNWEDELLKFDSNLTVTVVHGSKELRLEQISRAHKTNLVITTYDYLRNDYEAYEDIDFGFLIIDEAQYIKNQRTQTAKAVKKLKSDHRLALTGTPIENTLAELWSIFDFIMPGYLYTYAYFKRNFETPIIKENDEYAQKRLRAMVEPFILRRIKQDVLKDLPEKIEKVLRVEFSEEEEKIYLAKLAQGSKEIREILNADKVDNIYILKLLTELRQLCIDPRLLYDDITEVSSKIKACIELLESFKYSNQKTLLFSSFTKSLELIEAELKANNISYYKLTGANTKEERRQLVDAFQNDDTLVFLISLKAAGVGLNLTAAENVIHFDPWWNIAAENQASDRAYRIGQTKTVQVIKLIIKNSIEEKILAMQARKQEISDIFVEGASGSFASLSKDDILDLFNK